MLENYNGRLLKKYGKSLYVIIFNIYLNVLNIGACKMINWATMMKLLKSEEEYFRIILEKYENEPRTIIKNYNKENNINDKQNSEEIDKKIFKQFLNNKGFSCWVDVFLFISTYIFFDYLPESNLNNFTELSKIEMLSIIIHYIKQLTNKDLLKGIFSILSVEPYSIFSKKLNIETYAGTFNNISYLFNIFENNSNFCFKYNQKIYCNNFNCLNRIQENEGLFKSPIISIMDNDLAMFDNIESIISNSFNFHEVMCITCKNNGISIIDNLEFPNIITVEFHISDMENINTINYNDITSGNCKIKKFIKNILNFDNINIYSLKSIIYFEPGHWTSLSMNIDLKDDEFFTSNYFYYYDDTNKHGLIEKINLFNISNGFRRKFPYLLIYKKNI